LSFLALALRVCRAWGVKGGVVVRGGLWSSCVYSSFELQASAYRSACVVSDTLVRMISFDVAFVRLEGLGKGRGATTGACCDGVGVRRRQRSRRSNLPRSFLCAARKSVEVGVPGTPAPEGTVGLVSIHSVVGVVFVVGTPFRVGLARRSALCLHCFSSYDLFLLAQNASISRW
jgi:hypothetical protein